MMTDMTMSDEFSRMADDLIRRELNKSTVKAQARQAAWSDDLWSATAQAGWFDVLLAEEFDGLGLNADTAAGLFSIIGRRLVPGPYIDHIVAIPRLYPYAGPKVRARLDSARSGESVVVLVDAHAVGQELPDFDEGYLSGRVDLIRFAASADAFLVLAKQPNHGVVAVLVDAGAGNLEISPRESFDPASMYADLEFDAVVVDPDNQLQTSPEDFTNEIELLRGTIAIMLSTELAGLSRHLLDESVAYAKTREQFARPIGAFQPVQQILADMTIAVLALEAFTIDCARRETDLRKSSALVKAFASEVAREVGEGALQVHGGIAFTAEFELNRWFLHVLALQDLYGDDAAIYSKVGRDLLHGDQPV